MFIRASNILFSAVTLAGIVNAVPNALELRDSNCNGGTIQCCHSYQDSSTTFISDLFGYMGTTPPPAGTKVGFTCSPSTLGGAGSGSSCVGQVVCCNGNSFNGAIVTGCSPTTVNS